MLSTNDPVLEQLVGSRTRLLTAAVLANSDEPLTGYRIAKIAKLPREKVYPELSKGVKSGLFGQRGNGFFLLDSDLRALLRKRIRIRWDSEWDRARKGWAESASGEIRDIKGELQGVSRYDPKNRIRASALEELRRRPAKNRVLRKLGLRISKRKG
jgi:hypothetical protein